MKATPKHIPALLLGTLFALAAPLPLWAAAAEPIPGCCPTYYTTPILIGGIGCLLIAAGLAVYERIRGKREREEQQ